MEKVPPRVGVGVLVFRDGKVLMGRRKKGHMGGKYAGPGGHLEVGESIEDCVRREVKEETGLKVDSVRVICVSNLTNLDGRHYVDFGAVAESSKGDPVTVEPDKCEGWNWYDVDNLPRPMLKDVEEVYFDALKTGKFYYGTISKPL